LFFLFLKSKAALPFSFLKSKAFYKKEKRAGIKKSKL
jgi:hypothetical protein